MAYKRKTKDEFTLQGNYGYGDGWEDLTTEKTWKGIIQRKKEYRENEPGTPLRIIVRRIKIKTV